MESLTKIELCAQCACAPVCGTYKAVGLPLSKCDFYEKRRVRAKWVERWHDDGPYGDYRLFHCSNCDAPSARGDWEFCRECGAEMELEDNL